jgi:CDP-diacylglycerol--glycerol-3-phosphate 3-phosphatidyltransferase
MKKGLFFIPNSITILRFILTICFISILTGRLVQNSAIPPAALYILFVGICLSDLLDGAAARGLKAESVLGSILDISADSLFIFSSLITFNFFKVLPVWFTALVLADFLVFLMTSKLMLSMKPRNIQRILVFDMPGKIAAVLFYLIPIAAWIAFSHPARQSLLALNVLLYLSALLSGISMLRRLFLYFALSK